MADQVAYGDIKESMDRVFWNEFQGGDIGGIDMNLAEASLAALKGVLIII